MGYAFVNSKANNRKKLDTYLTAEFWKPEYDSLFSEEIVVDMPAAPPGMPQHMDAFDFRQYRAWLTRTVTNPTSVVQEAYGTPDPDVFWAIRDVTADVFWGKEPGKFDSKIFCRVEFKLGKIRYIKIQWNPLHFLYAVGADVPVFRMDLEDPRVDAFVKEMEEQQAAAQPQTDAEALDDSPEAIAQRIQNNLDAFRCDDYWYAEEHMVTAVPDMESKVWFLPPEMKETYPAQMMPRVHGWTALSCPVLAFDEVGTYWATDDPHVYFAEYSCDGLVDWIGNNAPGAHYRNRYFYVMRFDDLGRLTCTEEILNPINKFNSIGVSLPTFPYYFR